MDSSDESDESNLETETDSSDESNLETETDSSYEFTLKDIFEEIYELSKSWRGKFPWSHLHISIVRDYWCQFSDICHFPKLPFAKLLVRRFIRYNYLIITAKRAASFAQDLHEFFMVPRPKNFHESENLIIKIKKYQLVEAFIRFLLQLLCHKTDLNIVGPCKDGADNLEKELRFLLTIIGDASFLLCDDQHEQFQNLLAKFEEVAKEAGSLVHSLIFSIHRDFGKVNEDIGVVLNHIDRLKKVDIIDFLDLLSSFSKSAHRTPKSSVVNSLLSVDSLICDLEDLMNQEEYDPPIADVKDQLKIFHQRLLFVQSSINNTGLRKSPQLSEAGELKEMMMRVGDTANEAEYLIVSFLVGDAPSWYLSKRLTDINHRIKLIGTELQVITTKYKFGELKIAKDFSAQLPLQSKRNTEIDDVTVGFEEKETYILDLLVRGTKRQVISIFGMPGLGKTTLAKKLYNHPTVQYQFNKFSWCVVSQTYQRKSLLTTILISIKGELDKGKILKMEEGSIVEHIYKTLKGRRYLIVMDDIWDSNVLDDLLRCFPDDDNGSKILFTTRNKDVAPHKSMIYELPSLSNDQCWELLEKKVFHDKPCPPELREIGKKIAENCCGLPLAVVVIAGILSAMDKEKSTWEEVGRKLPTYIFGDQGNSVMQILKLSYNHLPQHLKPCFLLFGAFFQEDEEVRVGELMRLWVAEGIVHKEKEKSVEDVAREYLMELIDKSLVMVAKIRSDGGVKTCLIHDLLRDLCLTLCEEENYLKIMKSNDHLIYEKRHRFFYFFSSSFYSQHVRSLRGHYLNSSLYLRDMKLLRVLAFDDINGYAKMFGIEFLVFLRYLVINHLPASIGSLTNLEYLRVCEVFKIPPAILTMKKLRYLDIMGNEAGYDKDCNSSQTNNLEFLCGIAILDLHDELMLKCSPHLRKLKCSIRASHQVDLNFLTQLESLNLTFHGSNLKKIKLPSNIKKLTLCNLTVDSEDMSMFGRLENLEVFKLEESIFVGDSWNTRDGEFERLKFLKLDSVRDLPKWNVEASEHFPMLQRLILINCRDLEEIPFEIGEVPTLQLIEVAGESRESLAESAKRIQQEQRKQGNEELEVITNIITFMNEQSDQSETPSAVEMHDSMSTSDDYENEDAEMDIELWSKI